MPEHDSVERDEYGRIILPDTISQSRDAADAALALAEHFDGDEYSNDQTLAQLANAIQSVCRARWNTRSPNFEDASRYGSRVTFIDSDGEAHTAIVMEPEVASMSTDEAWDPYKEKMVNPQEEYPLGTVQLVYTPEYNLSDGFNFDRISDLEVATSVTPATKPDTTYCYYAGWDYALNEDE